VQKSVNISLYKSDSFTVAIAIKTQAATVMAATASITVEQINQSHLLGGAHTFPSNK